MGDEQFSAGSRRCILCGACMVPELARSHPIFMDFAIAELWIHVLTIGVNMAGQSPRVYLWPTTSNKDLLKQSTLSSQRQKAPRIQSQMDTVKFARACPQSSFQTFSAADSPGLPENLHHEIGCVLGGSSIIPFRKWLCKYYEILVAWLLVHLLSNGFYWILNLLAAW